MNIVRHSAAPSLSSNVSRQHDLYKTTITDGSEDDMQLTFFNNRYITSLLTEGAVYAFRGKVTGTFMRREMASPEFVPESRMQDMVPVYPQTSGLTSRIIANAVKEALRLLPETVKDPLPDALRLKYALCRLEYALKTIHFPNSPEALSTARRRLVFEELLVLQLGMTEIRRAGVRENHVRSKTMQRVCRLLADDRRARRRARAGYGIRVWGPAPDEPPHSGRCRQR